MAAPSKAQLLTDVHTQLKKRYKLEPRGERLSVLEAVVFGICHEGTTREQANQALTRFKDHFFDWNEVRVSPRKEIEGVLAGVPDAASRAQTIRRFLRQLFSKTYTFTLDQLAKKPLKDAIKMLQQFDALASDYVLATVIQQALGGHAMPVDGEIRRGLERLGVATPETDTPTLRSALERVVPKNRGLDLADLLEDLVHDTCVPGDPPCGRCVLVNLCPTGKAVVAAAKAKPKAAAKAAEPPKVVAKASEPPKVVAKASEPPKAAAPKTEPVKASSKSKPASPSGAVSKPKSGDAPAPASKAGPPPKGKSRPKK